MIRLFTILCKTTLEHLSDKMAFQSATDEYIHYSERCPVCGASGKLTTYSDYSRNLVSHDGKIIDESRIKPIRFKCVSCNTTHALLPGNLIPYSPYSLRFMLIVLIAYFERSTTVVAVCEHFGIAISTLYAWKHRLLSHKELLLGVLASQKESALSFLRSLFTTDQLSGRLSDFFSRFGFSFLQDRTTGLAKLSTAAAHSKPP